MPQYELSIRDYLRIVRKRRSVIILSTVVFGIVGAYYALKRPAIFEASTQVKIEKSERVGQLLTDLVSYNPGDMMESQTKIITGFPVLEKAAFAMGYIDEDTSDETRRSIVRGLQTRIQSGRVGATNIIRITVTSRPTGSIDQKRTEVKVLADEVAKAYIAQNIEEKTRQATKTRLFIEKTLADLEARLRKSEISMKEYGTEVRSVRIAESVQEKLFELQIEHSSLLQRYTNRHPRVVQIDEQIKTIEEQLKGVSTSEIEYARLEREVAANKQIYNMLMNRLEEVKIRQEEEVSDISIVDPAVLPSSPIGMKSKLSMVLGAFMGFVVGMILAFVAESLDTSMTTIDDVESVAGIPVLGVVPSIDSADTGHASFLGLNRLFPRHMPEEQKRRLRLISHYEPSSPVAEMFRNIKTNIKFSPSSKVLIITSAGSQEGKSTISTNIAIVAAQSGLKVVLVSADLRRPSLADTFGVKRRPGLGDILLGTAELNECLRSTADFALGTEMKIDDVLEHPGLDRLWLLPSGSSPVNPADSLGGSEMRHTVEALRKMFDVIILDSPPVLPVADVSILSPLCDAVLFCYEMGRTSRHALVRAKMQLESLESHILGIVLNHTHPETHLSGSYPYYYRYKYYYTTQTSEDAQTE